MEASAASRAAAANGRGLVPARLLRLASDERLVEEVRRGSQRAFEVVYDRHHRGLLAFCRHMLSSREEAEDAVQHTFMAAYRDLVSSTKPIQLRAWLYTIARNRCLSVLRARRERPVEELEDIPTEGLASEVQRRSDLQALLRDLAELPEDQRAALVLSEIGDLPHDEIAAVIGCRREKVKALVFQARSSLHASREGREMDCADVREQLSTLRGGALRRTPLRRHLRECAGCRGFKDEVERQRRAMAIVLPVVPTLGLKGDVLGAVFGTKAAAGAAAAGAAGLTAATGTGGTAAAGTAATAAAGGVAAGGGATVLAAKALVVAVAATGGAVGVKAATDGPADKPAKIEREAGERNGAGPGGGKAPLVVPASDSGDEERSGRGREDARGHTDRGKEFAKGRGKGRKRGLHGTQPGKTGERGRPEDKPAAGRSERSESRGSEAGRENAQRRSGRAKPRRRARTRPTPRPKAVRTPRPAPTPRPIRTPRPQPTPEPTPAPTVVPLEEATAAPTAEAESSAPEGSTTGKGATKLEG